jgi:hypothetical protein
MHGCIVLSGRIPNSIEPDHPEQDSNQCSCATARNNTTGLWEPALLKRLERKRLFKRLIKQTDWKNNLTATIVDRLGWPAQQNGWMASSCSAFHSTHFKRFAAWKTVDIASTFIIINMGAEQRIL